jgi:hypothetical protein
MIGFMHGRTIVALALPLALLATSLASGQELVFPITDKISGLAGIWTRDPSRGAGGICGVSEADTLRFELRPDAIWVTGRSSLRIPLTGTGTSHEGLVVASTDAGWLTITMTTPRNGGFANVMQEVYILNRDRSELTLWRTLNVRMPDGSSGKIDCGNRAAVIYRRQAEPF